MILPEIDLEKAMHKAEELRNDIEKELFTNELKLTCSFGLTAYIKGDTLDSIFIRSDNAMYRAKSLDKNTIDSIEV
jgi:GGDEF domain-containing protein